MNSLRPFRIMRALFISSFAVFVLGFSHLTFSHAAMSSMEGMSGHSGSSVQCQILCSAAIKTDKQGILSNLENEAKDPLLIAAFFGVASLSLLAAKFTVKRLHLLSSWRPPDRILLCGHYADGL